MKKYDIEALLADIKAVCVADLNTKVAAIEAEKVADGFPATNLQPIDATSGYFEQTWSDRVLNSRQAIFYGVEKVETQSISGAMARIYQCFIEIVLTDSGNDLYTNQRIHRYTRALEEIFQENYDKFPALGGKIIIETVRPFAFKLDMNSSEDVHVGGVSITVGIA